MPDLPPLGTQVLGTTPEGRQIILNADGTVSTERTVTVVHPQINGGRPTNIPTIFRGQQFDEDTAAEIVARFSQMKKSAMSLDPETGRELQPFTSIDEAVAGAKARSKEIGTMLAPLLRQLQKRQTR